MSKLYLTFLLGLFVAIVPNLGFPTQVKSAVLALVGIAIAFLVVYIRRDIQALHRLTKAKEINGGAFVEHTKREQPPQTSNNVINQ